MPFALKDMGIAMQGTVTTNGRAFFRDAVADVDSTRVLRGRKLGLIVVAKATSPEFGQTAVTRPGPPRAERARGTASGTGALLRAIAPPLERVRTAGGQW